MARKNLKITFNVVALFSLLGTLLFTPSAAKAATITVTTEADEYGESVNSCSLREAIHAANIDQPFGGCPAGSGADTIFLESYKTYQLTRTTQNPLTTPDEEYGDLDIASAMVISGGGSEVDGSVISAQFPDPYKFRIFHIAIPGLSATPVNFQHLRIQNGSAGGDASAFDGVGGGIYNQRSLLSLLDVVIDNNKATFAGGGIYNGYSGTISSLGIYDSTISNNVTTENYDDGTGTKLGGGGGIFSKGPLLIQNSLILKNNASKTNGGGLFNQSDDGLFSSDPVAKLINVTFTGNSTGVNNSGVAQSGAAIFSNRKILILNNTIAFNDVAMEGNTGALHMQAASIIINTIVAENVVFNTTTPANCYSSPDTLPRGANNMNNGAVCTSADSAFTSSATINLPLSPDDLKTDGGRYTMGYVIGSGSSAIDAGALSYYEVSTGKTYHCASSDYRWAIRPMKGNNSPGVAKCDIGAYEANYYVTGLPSFRSLSLPIISR